MSDFLIEDGVLKKYTGTEAVVVIPEGVTKIDDEAFFGNNYITTVEIPDFITEIGKRAFEDCLSLTKVTIFGNTKVYFSPFSGCPGIKSVGPIGSGCSVEYGWKSSIPGYAFSHMPELETVIISEDINTIERSAFSSCSKLNSISFPKTLRKIGWEVFQSCRSLTAISIPESVEYIGNSAFGKCTALKQIKLPENIEYLGDGAFKDCKNLSSVTLPKGIPYILEDTFANCANLTSLAIPEGVKSIGLGAFHDCINLSEVILPQSLEIIGLMDEHWEIDDKPTIIFNTSLNLEPYKRGQWRERTDKGVFGYCISLTSIIIPKNVTYIASKSFIGCKRLTSITIPKSVVNIGDQAFNSCMSLQTINTEVKLKKQIFETPSGWRGVPASFPEGPFLTNNPGMLPNEMKPGASIGFAEENADVTTECGAKHIKYIKSKAQELINAAFEHPALLQLMLENKLLTAEATDAYIEAAQQKNDTAILAALLDYKGNKLTQTEKKKATKKAEAREEKITEFIFDTEAAEKLHGKTIVVTGRLTTFNSRDELKACMDACGVTLTETLNAETDYLITNTPNSGSDKNKKAVELGITRITEAEFNEMISRKPKI